MPRARAKVTNDVDEESNNLFVTGPRGKKSKLSRLEEYDEDPGRAGSQKYQKLANMLEMCATKETDKSKAYLRQFRKDVETGDMELKRLRQQKEHEFVEGRDKIAAVFKQLSHHFCGNRDERPSTFRKEDHPLFKQAQANIDDHHSLLKQFKLVEEQLSANRLELPMARWQQDKREMTEILDCSGKYGETLVGSILAPEPAASPKMSQQNLDEDEQFVKELFKDNGATLDGETWGRVAEDQLKQFSVIARTVRLTEEA
ncbi:hypothetical protein F5Y14DRAFT_353455 [Nemania sp. NC0429]|nr:hypothetical protein F5Y14DRAFT_353455 [Nemania sp. NC0429]